MSQIPSPPVDLLILGAGWTSTFLIPLCTQRSVSCAATSRAGSPTTTKFTFDPHADDPAPFRALPTARTVLITFPIDVTGAAGRLVRLYRDTHGGAGAFIQLGTTSMWDGTRHITTTDKTPENKWYDRHAPFNPTPRALAETELLALAPAVPTTVLNLSGLWGTPRSVRNWVGKIAPTKEALRNKGSLHMIHGLDVARAILAVHADFDKATGQRWLLTDGRVYDWWDLASAWGAPPSTNPSPNPLSTSNTTANPLQTNGHIPSPPKPQPHGPQPRWVLELMAEHRVRALPRDIGVLGRALDSREFWEAFGLEPVNARLDRVE